MEKLMLRFYSCTTENKGVQLAVSPLRSQIEAPLEVLRNFSPDLVRQFLPILDQLLPIYLDVANGRQEFSPAPSETKRLVRTAYGKLQSLSNEPRLPCLETGLDTYIHFTVFELQLPNHAKSSE